MTRSNLQIKVGTYLGTGVAQTINPGFKPDMVFIKAETYNPPFKTRHTGYDRSLWLASTNAALSNYIKDFTSAGFTIGTGTNVNANGTRYYYVAVRGASAQSYYRVGKYVGDGTDNRNYTGGGLNFTPDLVVLKGDTAQQPVFRVSDLAGDITSRLDAGSNSADEVQSLISNGFQLGAGVRVNTSAANYYFFAMKKLSGAIATGTFTGDGTASRAITGLGFKPDVVVVKSNFTIGPRILTTDMVTNSQTSMYMTVTATDATGILSLDADGFTVGSGDSVNKAATAITWFAFKSGDYNVPVTRSAA